MLLLFLPFILFIRKYFQDIFDAVNGVKNLQMNLKTSIIPGLTVLKLLSINLVLILQNYPIRTLYLLNMMLIGCFFLQV